MRCFLLLSDGTLFKGSSFGAPAPRAIDLDGLKEFDKGVGEVVFNTGMTGYHEILTDPSYTGQIVVMSYPHGGNYGTDEAWSENGAEDRLLPRVKAQAFVVRDYYDGPVPAGRLSLSEFLKKSGTPGICEVDTRALTIDLRENGSRNGIILTPQDGEALSRPELDKALAYLDAFPSMEGRNCLSQVGLSERRESISDGDLRLVVVDCGTKGNIVAEMKHLGSAIIQVPADTAAEEIIQLNPDGVLYSNGPGDPATLSSIVEEITPLIGKIPLFGVCLGHQLLATALGGKTRKMKFGHHGSNNPVRDEITGKVAVTSQNHGFEVDEKSLGADTKIWFRNANDGSVEGILNEAQRVYSAQFHPEAAPGPYDSLWIFRRFYAEMSRFKSEQEA